MRFRQRLSRRAAVTLGALALVAGTAPAAAMAADSNGAFVVHENFSDTETRPIDNPCNGETVYVTGTFHFEITYNETASGIQASARTGVFEGTGVSDSGATYVVTEAGHDTNTLFGTSRQIAVSLNPTWHFVRTGPDGTQEDFFMRVVLISHLDLDTGMLTLDVEQASTECL
jgi:hypothetical protein